MTSAVRTMIAIFRNLDESALDRYDEVMKFHAKLNMEHKSGNDEDMKEINSYLLGAGPSFEVHTAAIRSSINFILNR